MEEGRRRLKRDVCLEMQVSPSHTHTHNLSHTHMHAHTHTCTHMHTHALTHMHSHTHTHSRTHTHAHAPTHKYIYMTYVTTEMQSHAIHILIKQCTHIHTHTDGRGGPGRWDKSLGVLCQKFVMLFLVSPVSHVLCATHMNLRYKAKTRAGTINQSIFIGIRSRFTHAQCTLSPIVLSLCPGDSAALLSLCVHIYPSPCTWQLFIWTRSQTILIMS